VDASGPPPLPASGKRRLFVALLLDGAIAAQVAGEVDPLLADCERLARGAPDDLHATLAFLGAVPEGERGRLERALARELTGRGAPHLRVRGTGAFPRRSRPRVLWAGIEEEESSRGCLEALHAAAWRGAGEVGIHPSEAQRGRPFHPHLTLARVRGRARWRAPADFFAVALDLPWRPRAAVLMESRLGPGGARYTPLLRIPLGDPEP